MTISLAPEVLVHLGPFAITNSLISGAIITVFLVTLILINSRKPSVSKPSKIQLAIEFVYSTLKGMTSGVLGKDTQTYWPFLLTFFVFILFSNWFGLLPTTGNLGVYEMKEGHRELIPLFRAPTSDISATMALALISIIAVNVIGFRTHKMKFMKKYFDPSNPINLFVSILETISELGKVISFTFRLFGNVFAGEVLLIVISGISMGIATLPFYGLEIFIGFIQAFVFLMLTTVFINLAINTHH
jgi:F-type H+-transporting ATPase subunit a